MPQPTYGVQNKTVSTISKRWGRFPEAKRWRAVRSPRSAGT